jgi:Cdc6-like AAA superfamily ATPase
VTTTKLQTDIIQLARIALTGRTQDVQLLLHRLVRRYRSSDAQMTDAIADLLREAPTRASPLRRQADVPLPVDRDTRLQLLKVEEQPELDHQPVFSPALTEQLQQIIKERASVGSLIEAGLQPTRSLLFTGRPGVGKTMAARWLATQLGRPLLTLDLAAVMSSYLGRTGGNVRHVLDYAKSTDCVLLLDELDAIAKRRDDNSEIGELKRLVTVLIQEIDDWPSTGLLVAATNHPELLDPAIWRRFEMTLEFPMPDVTAMSLFITDMLRERVGDPIKLGDVLALALQGRSFSDAEREISGARRRAALAGTPAEDALVGIVKPDMLPKATQIDLAVTLVERRVVSQRRAQELTGIARETIRARLKDSSQEEAE